MLELELLGCQAQGFFTSVFVRFVQLGVAGEGGLRGQDRGRTRHPHQEPLDQVRRPRLLAHPEEHRAEDAHEGHLAAPGGQDSHRQPKTLADLQIMCIKETQDRNLNVPIILSSDND